MLFLNKFKIFIFSLAGSVLIMPAFLAVPAVASAAPVFIHAPAAVNSSSNTGQSFNWSGYEATSGAFTGIGATWTIPNILATSSLTADATWIGIGGVTSHDLIQVGTQAITGNGASSTQYQAWFETLPQTMQQISLTVRPGDSITASIAETGSNEWQVSLRDNSTGGQYSTQIAYASSLSSAEWIEEAPSDQDGILPIDNFGSISFTNAYVIENGSQATIAGSGALPISQVSTGGQILAAPSALAADGASFTVTRTSVAVNSLGAPGSASRRGRGRRIPVGIQGFAPRARVIPSSSGSSSAPSSGAMGSFGTRFGVVFNFGNQPLQILQRLRQGFMRGS
jgi:hypothetical protein